MQQDEPVIDPRNKLNDLTGKEWLKFTKSYWISERSKEDKYAFQHPAPFLLKDTMKLISFFTKKNMIVLDPFVGIGTTLVAASKLGRAGLGIDLNSDYINLATERLNLLNLNNKQTLIQGDSKQVLTKMRKMFDYCVTSPPYHNILRNKGNGLRKKSADYRSGARTDVTFYSSNNRDLGNFEKYSDFLSSLHEIMKKVKQRLKPGAYCTLILSDFTVDKKEKNVQGAVVSAMIDLGYSFEGTQILLQETKPLYPFGYPYAFKINHHHQNMMHFRNPKN